jgi:hypothetical protein
MVVMRINRRSKRLVKLIFYRMLAQVLSITQKMKKKERTSKRSKSKNKLSNKRQRLVLEGKMTKL